MIIRRDNFGGGRAPQKPSNSAPPHFIKEKPGAWQLAEINNRAVLLLHEAEALQTRPLPDEAPVFNTLEKSPLGRQRGASARDRLSAARRST